MIVCVLFGAVINAEERAGGNEQIVSLASFIELAVLVIHILASISTELKLSTDI